MNINFTPALEGTCRISFHGSTNLILPDYDGRWEYALEDFNVPAWAADDKSVFALEKFTMDKQGQPVEAYAQLTIEPDILGRYAWVGNRALICEHLDLATGKHWFSFTVDVTDPDGMLAADHVIN